MVTSQSKKNIALVVTATIVGIVIGLLVASLFPRSISHLSREKDIVDLGSHGSFTNPLLACGDIDSLSVGVMEQLRSKVLTLVDNAVRSGAISHASVYVRDLNNGPWMGIQEKELFHPASLLKVPLMLAAYRLEEDAPGFLDGEVRYETPFALPSQLFPPAHEIEIGKTYTRRELMRRAVVFSDNQATALLGTQVGANYTLKVFTDFGIAQPLPNEDYEMRVRTYASFFRVLYNASYLSRKHSEEALKILAEVDFPIGVEAGVPPYIPVAHKFGEREGAVANGDYQLHDCGIVYTSTPYLLCVMTQGKTTDGMLSLVRTVSETVYDTLENRK
jgi:beta-lactamase class A